VAIVPTNLIGDTMISNTDKIIDSLDIIKRIEELREEREEFQEAIAEALSADTGEDTRHAIIDAESRLIDWEEDGTGEELTALEAVQDEAEGYASDWRHGEILIHENYFTRYAMEMLADIGDLPRDIPHYIAIDEEATAENIKADYTSVDFDGQTYYIRCS